MASLTVRLPDSLESALEKASRARGISKSDLAREAIERHLRVEALLRIRTRLAPHLESRGIFTEADVFERITIVNPGEFWKRTTH
jgi:predicted transcriptional regulator